MAQKHRSNHHHGEDSSPGSASPAAESVATLQRLPYKLFPKSFTTKAVFILWSLAHRKYTYDYKYQLLSTLKTVKNEDQQSSHFDTPATKSSETVG